jgi:hypothetical protein
MLTRYVKAQIIVLLCGGLVGPIFLITYFALPGMLGSFGPDVDAEVHPVVAVGRGADHRR